MGANCSSACCEGPAVIFPAAATGPRKRLGHLRRAASSHTSNATTPTSRAAPHRRRSATASEAVTPSASASRAMKSVPSTGACLTATRVSSDAFKQPNDTTKASVLLQVALAGGNTTKVGDGATPTPAPAGPMDTGGMMTTSIPPPAYQRSPRDISEFQTPRDGLFEPADNKVPNPFEPPMRWPRTTLAPRNSWSGEASTDDDPSTGINVKKTSPRSHLGAGKWFSPAAGGGAVVSPSNLASVTDQQQTTSRVVAGAAARTRELSVSFSFKQVNLLGTDADDEDFGDLHSAPDEESPQRVRSARGSVDDAALPPAPSKPISPAAPMDRQNTSAGLKDAFGDPDD